MIEIFVGPQSIVYLLSLVYNVSVTVLRQREYKITYLDNHLREKLLGIVSLWNTLIVLSEDI